MDNSCPILVAWSVPEASYPVADANRDLSAFGFVAEPLATADPGAIRADLAVLHSANFADLDQLQRTYDALSRPSLVVVASQEEETRVLRWPNLPLTADLCRAEALREQLPERLRRLAEATHAGIGWQMGSPLGQGLQKQVYGRAYLNDRLAREFVNARKQCRSLTLAWLEVGDLGRITKAFGDSVGNRVLKEFAKAVLGNIRVVDWLAQYGKDEFCLVMPDTWLEEGNLVVKRIEKDIRAIALQVDGQHTLTPRVNIGVAELTDHEESFEDLIQKAAEAALVKAIAG